MISSHHVDNVIGGSVDVERHDPHSIGSVMDVSNDDKRRYDAEREIGMRI